MDDLTDNERQTLIDLLTDAIQESKYPLSPRIERLKRIRAKLRSEELVAAEPQRARRPRRQ